MRILENSSKVKIVKSLSGKPWRSWDTNPDVFAIYEENDKCKGLMMSRDIADLINVEPYVGWICDMQEAISGMYPEIGKLYISVALHPLYMGYKNGTPERVMIKEA